MKIGVVIWNVVLNGLEATPEGGALLITSNIRGDSAVVQVIDHGGGIPEQNIANLFDPFYTTKKNGTGLGLAIVDKIIRAHRGQVDVESGEVGTKFIIAIPTRRNVE